MMSIYSPTSHRKVAARMLAAFGVFGVGVLVLPDAHSQTVDTSEWICEFCPFESGTRGTYDVGASSVSEDSAYFGDATGYEEEGVYANLDGEGSAASDIYRARWSFEDLGLDSRALAMDGGQPGRYDVAIAYRELPRRRFNTTSTVFLQPGGVLSLPTGWVRAPVTSSLSGLGTSLRPLNIGSDRSQFAIGGRYLPGSNWSLSADYRRQEQDGTRILGGSYFTNAALLPAAIDYVTDEVDVGIRYTGDRSVLSLGWYLSDFTNDQADFAWQHPFTTVAGGEFAALAQPPDSRFQQLTLSGAHAFGSYNAHASFSLAVGTVEQDESFLAYTSNANLATSPLPRSNLAGNVDTTRLAFSLTAKPLPKARVKLTYRYDERDNSTARDAWNRVIADSFVSGELESNVPYSFERSVIRASAAYRLFDNVNVSAGYDRKDNDYDFQEVAEQSEDSGWGRIRWQALPTLQLVARGGASKREIDRYNEVFAETLGQNPLLRKYNLAYRFRQFGEMSVAYSPVELPLSVTLNAMYADDSYTKSRIGLTSGDDLRLGADLNWTVADNASVYFNIGLEDISSTQFGSETLGDRDWRASVDDEFLTFGSGLVIRNIADKLDLQVDYVRTDGASRIAIDTANNTVDEFPELGTRFDQLRIRLSYRRSEQLDVDFGLSYQRFKAEDWALEGVGPATIPVILTLGAQPYSPETWVIGIGVRYRIGQKAGAGST
ncbi:MAG: MtrB/PioB family decaheme-associated outer membrane protein [Woeseiaceae bacterium]|nr:MtrB/PioB family decaheme-associated outer membrane protein [Woeseiaceae bacterium]